MRGSVALLLACGFVEEYGEVTLPETASLPLLETCVLLLRNEERVMDLSVAGLNPSTSEEMQVAVSENAILGMQLQVAFNTLIETRGKKVRTRPARACEC